MEAGKISYLPWEVWLQTFGSITCNRMDRYRILKQSTLCWRPQRIAFFPLQLCLMPSTSKISIKMKKFFYQREEGEIDYLPWDVWVQTFGSITCNRMDRCRTLKQSTLCWRPQRIAFFPLLLWLMPFIDRVCSARSWDSQPLKSSSGCKSFRSIFWQLL